MAHSSSAPDSRKPRKPHKTSDTLTARGDGRWCKRYKDKDGKWCWWYFRGTEAEALDEWKRVKADLLEGRAPSSPDDVATLRKLCNAFLAAKQIRLRAGKLNPRTFAGYKCTTDDLVEALGRERAVSSLRPADFQKLYERLAGKHGVATLGREITIIKGVFKHALESELIDRAVNFGPSFKAPSKTDKRRERNKNRREHGKRSFTAAEITAMLDKAGPQMKAMILLGINGGLGNTDCANLHLSHVDIDGGWLDYPRPKTEIDRRIPLWPETIEALKVVLAKRREPADAEHGKLVFLTRLGQPWVRFDLDETRTEDGKLKIVTKSDDAIAKATRKLLNDLGFYRRGVTFYALRHTFETVASGCKDQVAVDAIMGHVDDSMAAEYREGIDDHRLLAAVNHVHGWLYAEPAADNEGADESEVATVKAGTVPLKRQKASKRPTTEPRADGFQLRIVG